MKLVCLNMWGGKVGGKLFDYIRQQAQDADIFCFQEILDSIAEVSDVSEYRVHLLAELGSLLAGFDGFYSKAHDSCALVKESGNQVSQGVAIFYRQSLEVTGRGEGFIDGDENTEILPDFSNDPKNANFITVKTGGRELSVVNLQGSWHPGGKLDNAQRLEQSEKILQLANNLSGEKIVCGDFNLMPETQSIKMLEGDWRNLITEFAIKDTRGSINHELYKNSSPQFFADYIFVTEGIKVKSFQVPDARVSDHLPMILEFEL